MLAPPDPAFLGFGADPRLADVVLVGIPFEGRVNLRKGARLGSRQIRINSDSIESYSPTLGRDLTDLRLADLGDLVLPWGRPSEQIAAAREALGQILPPGKRAIALGGDHTAALPMIQVLATRYPELAVVQLDAHPDLRESFLDEPYNYASAMARVLDRIPPDRLWQIGIRAGDRQELVPRPKSHFYPAWEVDFVEAAAACARALAGRPVYVTIDIDVLDPAVAPGTGSPEINGVTVRELGEAIRLLASARVVGFDMTEVSPPHDPTGRTSMTAAAIIRDAILTWWGP